MQLDSSVTTSASPQFVEYLSKGREELHSIADELICLSKDLAQSPVSLQDLKARLDDIEIRIAIVGEMNRGKSTFLNCLVSTKLFPPRARVCTAALTILRDGEPRFRAHFRDGHSEDGELPKIDGAKALMSLVSVKNPDAKELEKVEVWFPNNFAREGAMLIDTPGVNDPEIWREKITLEALASADAAIFLLDASKPFSKSERNFLEGNILGSLVKRVIFVINKFDSVDKGDIDAVKERCVRELSKYVENPQIYYLAALPAYRLRIGEDAPKHYLDDFENFEISLNRFLVEERVELTLGSRKARMLKIAMGLRDTLNHRLKALDGEREVMVAKLDAAQLELNSILGQVRQAQSVRVQQCKLIPRELRSKAEHSWDNATATYLQSDSAIEEILSAASESKENVSELIDEKLAKTRRFALVNVENELTAVARKLEVQFRDEVGQVGLQLQKLTESVVGSVADASEPVLAAKIMKFAGTIFDEAGKQSSIIDGAAGFAMGILTVGLGIFVGLVSACFGEQSAAHARRQKVRIELAAMSKTGRLGLASAAENQALELTRIYLARVEDDSQRQIANARSNFEKIKSDIHNDQASLSDIRNGLLKLQARNQAAMVRLK